MLGRHRALWRLLAGLAALGGPAAIAAQQPVSLSLGATRELVIVDAWSGYSPVSPRRTTYSLRRWADGSFRGTVQITVGPAFIRRDTSFAVQLPGAAVDSVLQLLSEVPLREGRYRPTFTHTDDVPWIVVDLTVGDSVIRFQTASQGEAHVPWQVRAGGGRYVSASEAIWPALAAMLDRIGRREEQALVEAVLRDPDAYCGHGRSLPGLRPTPAQRPRYAAGEAWFTGDSLITVEGREYRKYGVPRVVGLHEISPHATYRGVVVYQEAGFAGTAEVLYVPFDSSCNLQPYQLELRP